MQIAVLRVIAGHGKSKAAALAHLTGEFGMQHKRRHSIIIVPPFGPRVQQALVLGVAKGIRIDTIHELVAPFCQCGQLAQLRVDGRCQSAHQRAVVQLDDGVCRLG